ncbi:MAG: RnfABCDGE type electron transport complex subunit G [Lachnospiraceae bacterium]|nr:RnfABCDGE type electron transport complex subunit G [Lachnospiraceae bacterium]
MNKGIVKDCIILFVITLVAGLLLGAVYEVTKNPIAAQEAKTKAEAQKGVFADASEFSQIDVDQAIAGEVESNGVTVDEVYEAVDASGAHLGYVVQATSPNSYGGDVTLMVGVTADGTSNGYSLLTINDTAGLGMNAQKDEFKDQYAGKQVESFEVTKTGASADNQIDAISGATITSNAVTEAVNACLAYANALEGGN